METTNMSSTDIRGMGYHTSPAIPTMGDLAEEVGRARAKFPQNRHMLAALVEEVGELAKALLEGELNEAIRAEALQVACVAIRIAEEGDADYPKADPSEGRHVFPFRAGVDSRARGGK
jgi:hypothetical protein